MKTFCYQIEVDAIPYNAETVEELFGKGSKYNSDYPEDCIAREVVSNLVRDAILSVLERKMNFISRRKIQDIEKMNDSDKIFWDYLCEKENQYRKIESTIKCII